MTGNILALTSAIAFALSNASAIFAFQAGSNPITLAAVRFVLPVLILVIWLTAERRRSGSPSGTVGSPLPWARSPPPIAGRC